MSENFTLGFPRWTDDAVFSGGSYHASYPVTNAGIVSPLSQVARTTDLLAASTQIIGTFPDVRPCQLFGLVRHNLSLSATHRLSLSSAAASTTWSVPGSPYVLDTVGELTALPLACARAGVSTYVNSSGLIASASANTIRPDYHPTTLAFRGILREATATNLLTYSEQFDNAAWSKATSTLTANAAVSPDGATTADSWVPNTASSADLLRASAVTVTADQDFAISGFFQASGGTAAVDLFASASGNGFKVVVNLATGAVISAAAMGTGTLRDSGVLAFPGNWYWVWVSGRLASGVTTGQWRVRLANAAGTDIAGDGTKGLYVWGAQLEAASAPSSYIPTTSAAVTRNADVLTLALTSASYTIVTEGETGTKTEAYTGTSATITPPGSEVHISRISAQTALLASGTAPDTEQRAVVWNVGGGLPVSEPQITSDGAYYVGSVSGLTFKLYADEADAIAETDPIEFTSVGTGTHHIYGSIIYHGDVEDVWPIVYPFGTVPFEDAHYFTGKYAERDIAGYNWTLPVLLDAAYMARSFKWEFFDTSNVSGQGYGYNLTPTVTITGDGAGATATATVVGGKVTSYTVTAPGTGYTTATVVVSGGGRGYGAYAVATISATTIASIAPKNVVQFGLCEVAQAWQVSINPTFGAQEGFRARTKSIEADGGVKYFERKDKPRVWSGQINYLPRDEALAQAFEMQRQNDLDVPHLWFPYPEEEIHWLRNTYLARQSALGLLAYSNVDAMTVPMANEEAL